MRAARWVTLAAGLAILVAGCATSRATADGGDPLPDDGRVACPLVEGQELPPECVPYDPEAAMAANDAYRRRADPGDGARAALEPERAAAAAALAPLADDPGLSAAAVVEALVAAGFDAGEVVVEVWGDPPRAEVIVSPGGACLVGDVGAGAVEVEVAGHIADGGCVPAQ